MWTLPGMAFAGALGTISAGLRFGARRAPGSCPAHTLLLSGAIVNAVLGSLLMFLVSVAQFGGPAQRGVVAAGQSASLRWATAAGGGVVVAAGLVVTVLLARDLNLMSLGEEPAAHLGLPVERTRSSSSFWWPR